MNDGSPGPGWWIASDGRWYPPRWEYHWFSCQAHIRGLSAPNPNDAMQDMVAQVAALGQQGWEMVNFTTTWVTNDSASHARALQHYFLVSCFMKRMAPV